MTTEKKQMPKRWTPEEETELLKLVKLKKSHEEIAKALGRSAGAPFLRLGQIAVKMIEKENKSISEVSALTGLTEEEIEKHLKFSKKKDKKKRESSTESGSQRGSSRGKKAMNTIEKKLDLILKLLEDKKE